MKILLSHVLCLCLLLLSSRVLACSTPLKEQSAPNIELIERTKNIILAQVVKLEMSGEESVVSFKSVKTIKGTSGKPEFSLRLRLIPQDFDYSMFSNFNNHDDAGFWMGRSYRSVLLTNCKITTTFELGRYYLVFMDEPFHFKSFEKISNENDKWLTVVNHAVHDSGDGKVELTLDEFVGSTYSAYIGRCPLNENGKRKFEVIKWLHGKQGPISQIPAIFNVEFKCRGYGAEYIGFKTSSDDIEIALPVIDGQVDFSGLHMDIRITNNDILKIKSDSNR